MKHTLIKSVEQCGGLKETVKHFIINAVIIYSPSVFQIYMYNKNILDMESCFQKLGQINKKCN